MKVEVSLSFENYSGLPDIIEIISVILQYMSVFVIVKPRHTFPRKLVGIYLHSLSLGFPDNIVSPLVADSVLLAFNHRKNAVNFIEAHQAKIIFDGRIFFGDINRLCGQLRINQSNQIVLSQS